MNRQTTPLLGQIVAALHQSDGWKRAVARLKDGAVEGRSQEELVERVAVELASEGITPDELLGGIPAEMRGMVEPTEWEGLRQGLPLLLAAMVAEDALGKEPELLNRLTGSPTWTTCRDGMPLVWCVATPFTAEQAIAAFTEKCYQTFPAESFGNSRNVQRDSEWFMRNVQDSESYRDIALTDPRSGLAEEVRVNPEEYPDEVRRAAGRVGKAIQRVKRRWTKMGEILSIEED